MSSEVTTGTSAWLDFLGWIETNKNNLMYAGVGVVALAFVVSAYRWNVNRTEANANSALLTLKANQAAASTGIQPLASAAEYQRIASQFGGTSAGQRALLFAAASLFSEGKYAEAQNEFNKALNAGNGSIAPLAAYGVATSLEAQGKQDEAIKEYQTIASRFPRTASADEGRFAAARILESRNQFDQAVKIYDEMIAAAGASGNGSQAASRKQQLVSRHPELAAAASATNAAASKP
jgi:predicted negative regulator of RcsB-dependent stress response